MLLCLSKNTVTEIAVLGWRVDLVCLLEACLAALLLPLLERTGEENKVENIMPHEENRDCSLFSIMGKTDQLGRNQFKAFSVKIDSDSKKQNN